MTNQPPPSPQGQGWGAAPPPSQPPPGQGWGPAPDTSTIPAPQQRKGGAGRKVLGIAGGVAAALIVTVVFAVGRNLLAEDETAEAKQGDCIASLPESVAEGEEVEANDAKVVECGSADARYSVVGRIDNLTASEASADSVCDTYRDAGAEMIYYAIPTGGKGYVLCLKPA